jgi:hypothetical protein
MKTTNNGTKPMRILLAFFVVATAAQLCHGGTWIVTKVGIWEVRDGVPVRVTSENDQIVIDGTPLPPDGPGGGDVPPAGSIADKVKAISKQHVKSEEQATALLAVVRVFRRPDIDLTKARSGLRAAMQLLKPLFDGNSFDKWLAEIETLHAGNYTPSFLASIDKGLASAFDLSSAGAMTDAELQRVTAAADQTERLDLIKIFEIIRMLIELLRDLGILGATP